MLDANADENPQRGLHPRCACYGSTCLSSTRAARRPYVVVVAAGDEALDPVHPGAMPFAVTNPIFFTR